MLLSIYCLLSKLQAQPLAELSTNFEKHGLKPGSSPEKWEDGMRTSGEKNTFEWWYFDAHLNDGSTLVVVFYTKPFTRLSKGLTPYITIDLEKPDGTKLHRSIKYDPDQFKAATDSCHVQIGSNYIKGNLKEYYLHFADETLQLDARIKRTVDSWRPGTGILEFGPKKEDFFAWLAVVPHGTVALEMKYQGKTQKLNGSAYHDHNWGNKSLNKLFNHWYWSRAQVGPYTIIAAEMITEKAYNNESLVVFNLSKNGKLVADNHDLVKAYRSYGIKNEELEKDVSDDISFIYQNEEDGYTYQYHLHRERNLAEVDLLQGIAKGKNLKYYLARWLTGFKGAYFRFTGTAELKVFQNDQLLDTQSSPTAIWELMYLGDAYRY